MADKIDISAVARVVDQASGPLKAIQGSIQAVSRAAAATQRTFANLGGAKLLGAFRGVGASIGNLGRQMRGLLSPLTALVGIAGIAGAVSSMKSYIDTASQLYWTSKRLGLSAEDLQKYRYAANQMGVSSETLEKNLGMLYRTMGKAAQGGKEAAKITPLLRKFGITMQEIKAGDMAAILPKLAKGFEANVNPLDRIRVATALFGRGGQQMINMLAGGAENMRALMAEAERMGLILNEDALNAKIASDALLDMNKALDGVKNAIIGPLVPGLTALVLQFKEWTIANREWIATNVQAAFKTIGDTIKAIDWTAIGEGFRRIGDAIKWVVDLVGGWENAIIGMVALLNPLTPALLAVAAAFIKLGIAMLTTPIGWIIAAIAAVAAGAYLLYKNWDTVAAWFAELWGKVKAVFDAAYAWLDAFVGEFIPGGLTTVWAALSGFFSGLWTGVKAVFDAVRGWYDAFTEYFGITPLQAVWAGLLAHFSALWTGVKLVFDTVRGWYDAFTEYFGMTPIQAAWAGLAGFFSAMWSTIKGVFQAAYDFIAPIVEKIIALVGPLIGAVSGVRNAASGVAGAISSAGSTAGGAISSAYEGAKDFLGFGKQATAAPAVQPTPNLVAQAAAAQPQRIQGEIENHLKVDLSPNLVAELKAAKASGAVARNDVEVGRSMQPAAGFA